MNLPDIILTVCSGLASVLMGIVLFELRSLRDKVSDIAVSLAKLQGMFEARRGGDWNGEERREKN